MTSAFRMGPADADCVISILPSPRPMPDPYEIPKT